MTTTKDNATLRAEFKEFFRSTYHSEAAKILNVDPSLLQVIVEEAEGGFFVSVFLSGVQLPAEQATHVDECLRDKLLHRKN